MKKIILILTIIITVLITILFMLPFTANAKGTVNWRTKINGKEYYAAVLIVKKVDRKHNKVYCKNWCNFPYKFTGVNDLEKGDVISCIMYTKNTSNIKDDVVITAGYERVDLLK